MLVVNMLWRKMTQKIKICWIEIIESRGVQFSLLVAPESEGGSKLNAQLTSTYLMIVAKDHGKLIQTVDGGRGGGKVVW